MQSLSILASYSNKRRYNTKLLFKSNHRNINTMKSASINDVLLVSSGIQVYAEFWIDSIYNFFPRSEYGHGE